MSYSVDEEGHGSVCVPKEPDLKNNPRRNRRSRRSPLYLSCPRVVRDEEVGTILSIQGDTGIHCGRIYVSYDEGHTLDGSRGSGDEVDLDRASRPGS